MSKKSVASEDIEQIIAQRTQETLRDNFHKTTTFLRLFFWFGYFNEYRDLTITTSGAIILDKRICNVFTIAFDEVLAKQTQNEVGLVLGIHHEYHKQFQHLFDLLDYCYLEMDKERYFLCLAFKPYNNCRTHIRQYSIAIEIDHIALFEKMTTFKYLHTGRTKVTTDGIIKIANIIDTAFELRRITKQKQGKQRLF